jgi:hypothetical protein
LGTTAEIWVKAGTYEVMSTILLDKAIHLYGGFAGNESLREQRDWEHNVTTMSGADLVGSGFAIQADAVIDGFVITRFYTHVRNESWDEPQGALKIENASPSISHVDFIQNRSRYGGAIFNRNASPVIRGCTFSDNAAWSAGAAIYNVDHSSPTIDACSFTGNMSDGACIYNSDESSPIITNSILVGNKRHYGNWRSGIAMYDHSWPEIRDTIFMGNYGTVLDIGSFPYGGAADNSAPLVDNCLFTGNTSISGEVIKIGNSLVPESPPTIMNSCFTGNIGTPIYNVLTYARISGCTFRRNSSPGVNAIHNYGSVVTVEGSLFADNEDFYTDPGTNKSLETFSWL